MKIYSVNDYYEGDEDSEGYDDIVKMFATREGAEGFIADRRRLNEEYDARTKAVADDVYAIVEEWRKRLPRPTTTGSIKASEIDKENRLRDNLRQCKDAIDDFLRHRNYAVRMGKIKDQFISALRYRCLNPVTTDWLPPIPEFPAFEDECPEFYATNWTIREWEVIE